MNATLPMFVLHLQSTDDAALRDQLRARVGQAPEFFQATPVVLSLAAIADADYVPDWAALCDFLRELGMRPAGIMDASEAQRDSALNYGLAQFPDRVSRKPVTDTGAGSETHAADGGNGEPAPRAIEAADAGTTVAASGTHTTAQGELALDTTPAAAVSPAPTSVDAQHSPAAETAPRAANGAGRSAGFALPGTGRAPAMVVDKTVRSGQRIYADGTDLIVLAVVSAGAELIADGDIHVYAPLRGRALAGARGNAEARIFSQSMEAELVSIAGNFKILEDIPADLKGKPAQVFLEANGEQPKVVMQPLGALRNS